MALLYNSKVSYSVFFFISIQQIYTQHSLQDCKNQYNSLMLATLIKHMEPKSYFFKKKKNGSVPVILLK